MSILDDERPPGYRGRHRNPDDIPAEALDHLALAEWALKRGEQTGFLKHKAEARAAIKAHGIPLMAGETMLALHTFEARDIAEKWRTDWQTAMDLLGDVQVCTGDHLPGPRRMAGPDFDWCTWCESAIPLDRGLGGS